MAVLVVAEPLLGFLDAHAVHHQAVLATDLGDGTGDRVEEGLARVLALAGEAAPVGRFAALGP
ncbi:hypothetical protein ABZ636_23425 [Streptomyces sp. NPDC007251]|uniref:hypothetical protein n=1 Tax=Streptomyces sp. NPDC007251 TaxID=3154483 RepID=UPI0033F2424E